MANELIQMPENFGTYDLNGTKVALTPALIKQNICSTLTDVEIFNFGFLCQQNNLNPFTREAYAVKYGTNPASLIISKQGLANRAERNGHLKSKKGGIIETRQNVKTGEWETKEIEGAYVEPGWTIYGGWAVVTRDDREEQFFERVLFSEYNNDKNPLWKSKTCTMLAKVAMQHALREAFPCETPAGVYYEEEFSDDLNQNRQHRQQIPASHSNFEEAEEVPSEPVQQPSPTSQPDAPQPVDIPQ